MSKGKKRVDGPAIITIDDLAVMSDDELSGRANRFESERNRVRDSYPWEVEIAYVRREQQIRRQRVDTHSAWIRHNPQDNVEDFADSDGSDGSEVA
jgi:hypothetical protein